MPFGRCGVAVAVVVSLPAGMAAPSAGGCAVCCWSRTLRDIVRLSVITGGVDEEEVGGGADQPPNRGKRSAAGKTNGDPQECKQQ